MGQGIPEERLKKENITAAQYREDYYDADRWTQWCVDMLTVGGKKVFRNGHWHGGGDWDAEDVYERLSFSWNDLGTYIGTHWFIGTLVHIPVHIGTYISTYWLLVYWYKYWYINSWNDLGTYIQPSSQYWFLSPVSKVEISKSTDKLSDSFKVEIYETAETAESPKTDSTVGLTRFVGYKIKRMSKFD